MKNNKFILYPAIDIKNGKCVRLLFGDMEKETIYGNNPVDQALWFVDQGAEWLHIVDLDGAIQGENVNKKAILEILKKLQNKVKIQIGGGIRNHEQIDFWLQNSIDRVILGTVAMSEPNFIINLEKKYYKKIVIGTDVRNGKLASHGWKNQSDINAVDLIQKFDPEIIDSIIYTDISRDGSLQGVNLEQTLTFARSVNNPVIASGGVYSLNEIYELSKNFPNGIEGVIIGRALYDKKFSYSEALNIIEKV
ncbi:1-(5-phosphoribosyl)-5-[(5-phosphoribosylamino)methylideneamino]imidazole-4-carboxamide isomerase [Alphaproteobacteria bacterium]|nr:1-(5-phosphoribosyl)-5-[(5-phosphoribosylamino)methylideneamino]imidazole-4-carboxamide isomerase [Alphaproteobacteria bacterium]